MKNIIKKISFAFILFAAMVTTVNAATTVKETANDFTNGKAYYVIGSTKFEDVTLTIQTIGTAYQHEYARLGDFDKEVKTLYKSPISGNWSTIKADGSMTPVSNTDVYENLDIYFVNNEVKMLDLKLDTDEKIGDVLSTGVQYVEDFNTNFDDLRKEMATKITYNASTKTFSVPSIVTQFKVKLGTPASEQDVSVVNGTLVKTAALLVSKVTDIAGKELNYTTNASGDINITSVVPFEVKVDTTDSYSKVRRNGVVLYFPGSASTVSEVAACTYGAEGAEDDCEVEVDNYSHLAAALNTVVNSENKTLTIDMTASNSGSPVKYDYLKITVDGKIIKLSANEIEAAPAGKITRVAYFSENKEVNVDDVKIENGNVTINKELDSFITKLRIYISAPAGYSLKDIAADESLNTSANIVESGNEYYFEINTSDLASTNKTVNVEWASNNKQPMNIVYISKVSGKVEAYTTDVDAKGAKDVYSSLSSATIPALDSASTNATHFLNIVVVKPAGYVGTPKYAIVDSTVLNRSKDGGNSNDLALAAIDAGKLNYVNLPSDGRLQVKFANNDTENKVTINKVAIYVKWSDESEPQKIDIDASSATFELLPAVIEAEDVSAVFDSDNQYKQHILDLGTIKIYGADGKTDATDKAYSLTSSNPSVVKVITKEDVDAHKYYQTSLGTEIGERDIGKLLIIGSGEANITIKSDRLGSLTKTIKVKVTTPVKFTYELKPVSDSVGVEKTFDLTVKPTGGSGEYVVTYELFEEDSTFSEVKYTGNITANDSVRLVIKEAYKGLKIKVKDAKIDGEEVEVKIKVADGTEVTE